LVVTPQVCWNPALICRNRRGSLVVSSAGGLAGPADDSVSDPHPNASSPIADKGRSRTWRPSEREMDMHCSGKRLTLR
jgi:hypothetical protein